MLQAVIRKHGEVLSKGWVGGNITKEGVGVPTGGVTGGGGGVKRVSSVRGGSGAHLPTLIRSSYSLHSTKRTPSFV